MRGDKSNLKDWGIEIKPDAKCAVCKEKAEYICTSSCSLMCGNPLCENCKCPIHDEYGVGQEE